MKCPYCGMDNNYVKDHSIKEMPNGEIKRTRRCMQCNEKFRTVEFYADRDLVYRHAAGKIGLERIRQVMERRNGK